jgi:hypothetical protein
VWQLNGYSRGEEVWPFLRLSPVVLCKQLQLLEERRFLQGAR